MEKYHSNPGLEGADFWGDHNQIPFLVLLIIEENCCSWSALLNLCYNHNPEINCIIPFTFKQFRTKLNIQWYTCIISFLCSLKNLQATKRKLIGVYYEDKINILCFLNIFIKNVIQEIETIV